MSSFFEKVRLAFATKHVVQADVLGTVKAEAVPVESHRLTQDVYKQLERDLLRLAVGPTTTELQAGYQLGVAAVLEKLRNGIVIGG